MQAKAKDSSDRNDQAARHRALIDILACACLAIVVSVVVYVARTYGALWSVYLAAGAAILIVLYLLPSRRLAAALFNRVLPLLPFLVVGAHLFRPEVLLLRLAAVAAVLVVGDVLFQGLYAWILSRGGTYRLLTGADPEEGFTTLHLGHFFLVVVVGTMLAIWWGWYSTGILLFLDGAWQGAAGLIDRRTLAG